MYLPFKIVIFQCQVSFQGGSTKFQKIAWQVNYTPWN